MAIIPYAVDVPYDRRPVMNWLLVGSVIFAYVLEYMTISDGGGIEAIEPFVLHGWNLQGLIGHMWLHAGFWHLFGNMLFLWVFGNAVCAKIGNLTFIPVYILLGVLAASTHLIFAGGSAVGASGAINGIVGMFLIFFWENEVHCLWMFSVFYVRTFSISSFWLIGLWLAYDIAGAIMGGGSIGYFAHLGGFFAGIGVAILLLKLNWVTMYRDEESLVERFEGWLQDRRDTKLERLARDAVEQAQQDAPSPVRTMHTSRAVPAASVKAAGAVQSVSPSPAIVRFRCSCGKIIKTSAKYAGRKGLCPECGQELIVPRPRVSV